MTLEEMMKVEQYGVVLEFAKVKEGTGHRVFQRLMDMPKSIIGKAPNEFTTMANVTNIPSPLPTLTDRQLCRLCQFLNNNGGYRLLPVAEDGDCFFGSFRRSTSLPYDVADVHLRRLIIKGICNNHLFYNLFHVSIAQTYGHVRDTEEELQRKIDAGTIGPQDLREQRRPGPFSVHRMAQIYDQKFILCRHTCLYDSINVVEHPGHPPLCRITQRSKIQAS